MNAMTWWCSANTRAPYGSRALAEQLAGGCCTGRPASHYGANGFGPFETESSLSRVPVLDPCYSKSPVCGGVLNRSVLSRGMDGRARRTAADLPYNLESGHVQFSHRRRLLRGAVARDFTYTRGRESVIPHHVPSRISCSALACVLPVDVAWLFAAAFAVSACFSSVEPGMRRERP